MKLKDEKPYRQFNNLNEFFPSFIRPLAPYTPMFRMSCRVWNLFLGLSDRSNSSMAAIGRNYFHSLKKIMLALAG